MRRQSSCAIKLGIDLAAEIGTKSVITFTGMREKGLTDAAGARNCVEAWKAVMPYAEKKKINLVRPPLVA